MSRFLLGFTAPLLIAFVALIQVERVFFLYDLENAAWLGALLLGAPVSAAIVSCALAQRIRRPRCLDASRTGFVNPALRGAVAGSATIACVLLVVSAFAAHRYSDILLILASAGAFAFVSVLASRRVHMGGCDGCGYDLSGVVADRCPECGGPVGLEPGYALPQ